MAKKKESKVKPSVKVATKTKVSLAGSGKAVTSISDLEASAVPERAVTSTQDAIDALNGLGNALFGACAYLNQRQRLDQFNCYRQLSDEDKVRVSNEIRTATILASQSVASSMMEITRIHEYVQKLLKES